MVVGLFTAIRQWPGSESEDDIAEAELSDDIRARAGRLLEELLHCGRAWRGTVFAGLGGGCGI
jgi:hypothetical protein